jgi:thiol-disulfide isomerase/thioredoxin
MAAPVLVALALACSACSGATVGPSAGRLPTSAASLPTVDIGQFRTMLAAAHGTPVLLNVWASWCGPCISEAPALASLAKDYAGRDTFVGLDVQDTTPSARAFISRYGWTFPSVADPSGQVRNGLGFVGQPVTVVFDAAGKQVFARSGPITVQQIREALAMVS